MKYSIGLDFGTLSARAVLVDLENSREVCHSAYEYPHGVMSTNLHSGEPLPDGFALQHPRDYLDAIANMIPAIISMAGIDSRDIIGVGVDFTSCSILPVRADGTPLCFEAEFKNEPHAYVKLWKHHSAQPYADKITRLAELRSEPWLKRYGGKISSEWMLPKIMETLDKAPRVFKNAVRFIEAGDWLIWMMTGTETHNACMAGYKALWNKREGFPSREFMSQLDPRLESLFGTKVSDNIIPLGIKAAEISEHGARLTGLTPGTAVAPAVIDAHAASPAAGITGAGQMLLIIGTSGCNLIMSEAEHNVDGICGTVEDGVYPDFFAYEAGQTCLGDHFDWFVKKCVPANYTIEAQKQGVSIHKYLREKAKKLSVGESGLICLDWWNGNRSILEDADLSGVIIGLDLRTTPEQIYRALLESVAFGAKVIIDHFEKCGIPVGKLFAAGGIAQKDELLMQIYADVTGRTIHIVDSAEATALGTCVYGACAAGYYRSLAEGAKAIGKLRSTPFVPNMENHKIYNLLFAEYKKLHDYFGTGENNVMKRLKEIKNIQKI